MFALEKWSAPSNHVSTDEKNILLGFLSINTRSNDQGYGNSDGRFGGISWMDRLGSHQSRSHFLETAGCESYEEIGLGRADFS